MPILKFIESSFKHGLTEKEIENAMNDEELFYDKKTEIYYGQSSKGDWVEIKGRFDEKKISSLYIMHNVLNFKKSVL